LVIAETDSNTSVMSYYIEDEAGDIQKIHVKTTGAIPNKEEQEILKAKLGRLMDELEKTEELEKSKTFKNGL